MKNIIATIPKQKPIGGAPLLNQLLNKLNKPLQPNQNILKK